jgi:hypothetical protein
VNKTEWAEKCPLSGRVRRPRRGELRKFVAQREMCFAEAVEGNVPMPTYFR